MPILRATKKANTRMGFLMRYIEQFKYSLTCSWRVSNKCLDKLTGGLQFWVAGLLAVLCFIPSVIEIFTPETNSYLKWYLHTPVPTFELSLSQELATTDYYWKLRDDIPFLMEFNYIWVKSKCYRITIRVLVPLSLGLLAVAYVKEGESW